MRIYLGLNDISDPDPGRTILFWDHVFKAGHECKVWLDDFTIAFNRGFKPNEIYEIRRMVTERRAEIVERWLEHGRHAG